MVFNIGFLCACISQLVNRHKNSKKKNAVSLTQEMLSEFNKSHMGSGAGGLDNYGADDLYNMDDVWNDKQMDKTFDRKPTKVRTHTPNSYIKVVLILFWLRRILIDFFYLIFFRRGLKARARALQTTIFTTAGRLNGMATITMAIITEIVATLQVVVDQTMILTFNYNKNV